MTDLIEFLRARLDEDERAALNATQHRWIVSGRRTPASPTSPHGDPFLVASDEGFGAPAFQFKDERDAAHIARHDPARVLVEVDAKRAVVEQFTMINLPEQADGDTAVVGAYVKMQAVLRLLALPYVNHPGYKTEWAPA